MVYEVAREEDEDMWGQLWKKLCNSLWSLLLYWKKKERMRLVLTGDSGWMGNFQFNRNLALPFGRSCMYKIWPHTTYLNIFMSCQPPLESSIIKALEALKVRLYGFVCSLEVFWVCFALIFITGLGYYIMHWKIMESDKINLLYIKTEVITLIHVWFFLKNGPNGHIRRKSCYI